MEFKKDTFDLNDDSNYSVNLRNQIDKYLLKWKWFLLSAILFLFFAGLKLNFTPLKFSTNSTIQIKDTKGRDNDSELAAFQELGIMNQSNSIVEDQIEILKSKRLITEMVKKLKLNIQYFSDENSVTKYLDNNLGTDIHYFKKENYLDPPVNINFFTRSRELYNTSASFKLSITSATGYIFNDLANDIEKKYSFGEKIETSFGNIIVTPNFKEDSDLIGEDILVKITPLKSIVAYFMDRIKINPLSEFSSILNLTIEDRSKEKSQNALDSLVKIYNDEAIRVKERSAKNTAEFVKKRLEVISEELSTVDLSVEQFKQKNRVSDMSSQTGLNLQVGTQIESQIVDANTQIQLVESMKEYIDTKDSDEQIPVNLGFADKTVDDISKRYNDLVLEKQRLLKSSTEKNPVVQNLSATINSVKSNLDQSLENLQASKTISLNALSRQNSLVNSRIYSAPKKERQMRDIERQQQIKENLFLYILQKREESAISLGVAGGNAKVIDTAESKNRPVSPNKIMTYLGALILGLFLPFALIYSIDFFDTKVHTREDIEKVLNIPILGDIPKLDSKKKNFLISKNDHTSIAEAFRILRTNLAFLLTQSKKTGKTIFVTSTIAHEGKSLVASNLAASFALAGKKTLILGMDVRAPGLKPYLGIRGTKGLTNYVVDSNLTEKDVILKVPNMENLHLISSGDIPPNPAELLMHNRIKELFDIVKKEYEYIIVDTAAASAVTDTMLLSEYSDTFVYVVRSNVLDKRRLNFINSLYKKNRFPNMAILVNGVDHKKSYGYGYGYGYGSNFERSKAPWWKGN